MTNRKKFIVSHAPFWHYGSNITERSYHTMLAALPAVFMGIFYFGAPAISVVALSVSAAIGWELAINKVTKQTITIGDGNAALIGLLFAMLVPATMPWWAVLTGTFIAVIIGKHIFGGIGGNVFNPVVLAVAILAISWKYLLDFDAALLNYDLGFMMAAPLVKLKAFGVNAVKDYSYVGLLFGRQAGGIGSGFGLGLIAGGAYLILRGFIRWEIALSFLAGVFGMASVFFVIDPGRYADPLFHLLTGYTLIGAFFLA
ncbi:MAG: RnfABCDGE type electron transport complex subunit D, partial [Desulfobacterales bacterium]